MKSQRAFTLIEVLIAILLISVVSGVVATSLVSNIRLNAEGRVREQAITAAHSWIERFKAKTLDFSAFQSGNTYDYHYRYSSDSTFVAAGDPDPTALDEEWGNFKFHVQTWQLNTNPLIWRVKITTYYRKPGGGEGHFSVETAIRQ